jgi:hypothetical protein
MGQSRPDSGLDLQVKVHKLLKLFPLRSKVGGVVTLTYTDFERRATHADTLFDEGSYSRLTDLRITQLKARE